MRNINLHSSPNIRRSLVEARKKITNLVGIDVKHMKDKSRLANTALELHVNVECAKQKQRQLTFPMRIMRNLCPHQSSYDCVLYKVQTHCGQESSVCST